LSGQLSVVSGQWSVASKNTGRSGGLVNNERNEIVRGSEDRVDEEQNRGFVLRAFDLLMSPRAFLVHPISRSAVYPFTR